MDRDLGLSGHQGITRDRDGCWESNMVRAKMMEASNERVTQCQLSCTPHSQFLQPEGLKPRGWGHHWEPQKEAEGRH